eukprot:g1280.t1
MASKTTSEDPKSTYVLRKTYIGCPAPRPKPGYSFKVDVDPKNPDVIFYGSKREVVIRNLKDSLKCDIVGGHKDKVTVARIAGNNNWIASGDESGTIRVWAYKRADHIKKLEKQWGPVNDIRWGPESRRIVAGGMIGVNKVSCFAWDSGSEYGKMGFHQKSVNSVDMRQERPYRIFSGAEDMKVNMYTGPPFKYSKRHKTKNFVNQVRISPDGTSVCAVNNASEKVILDAKTCEVKSMVKDGQKGMLLSCSWTKDSKSIFVSSSLGTNTITDVEEGKITATLKVSADHQRHMMCHKIGFAGDKAFGVTRGGDVVIWGALPVPNPSTPEIYSGHQFSITSIVSAGATVFSTDAEGCLIAWDKPGMSRRILGTADPKDNRLFHKGAIVSASVSDGRLVTVGIDTIVRTLSLTGDGKSTEDKLGGTPSSSVSVGKYTFVLTTSGKVVTVVNGAVVDTVTLEKLAAPDAFSAAPDGSEIAVGVKGGTVFHLYSVEDGKATFKSEVNLIYQKATALAYSPDSTMIAVGTDHGLVNVYKRDGPMKKAFISGDWKNHNKVGTVTWGASSKYLVSTAVDSKTVVCFIDDVNKRIVNERTHFHGTSACAIVSPGVLVTGGGDCTLNWWSLEAPEE